MKREVKIGIFAVAMIGCAWAGIRFLSGFDIFSRNVDYYAAYDQINGVQTASPVMIKGVKVGSVTGISFEPSRSSNVVLKLTVKKQYGIPENSEAKIFSSSIMGAKAIEIDLGSSPVMLEKGDTIRASRDRDMMDVAASELDFFKQKVSQLTGDLSRTLAGIDALIEDNRGSIQTMTAHLNSISGSVDGLLASEGEALRSALRSLTEFSQMLGRNTERVDSIVDHVDRFTGELADAGIVRRLDKSLTELNDVLGKIDRGDGTLGKLLNDGELYGSLEEASANLSALLADLKANPKRYVHFSLFGRSDNKDRREQERTAERARKDSLRQARRSAR